MVVLRNIPHYDYRPNKAALRSTKHHKVESRLTENRKSPRIMTKGEDLSEKAHDRIPTTSVGKKNEESAWATSKDLAVRSKRKPNISRNNEQHTSLRRGAKYSHFRKGCKGKITRARARKAKLKRSHSIRREVDRNRKDRSAIVERCQLDKEAPMIIECWQ
ncbi:hypothetical protein F5Y10DRAFT_293442 [Nemania abortiva]|nr:hypothetical protein F5Y10DRAFT_293442 [Nemania abortiva]